MIDSMIDHNQMMNSINSTIFELIFHLIIYFYTDLKFDILEFVSLRVRQLNNDYLITEYKLS